MISRRPVFTRRPSTPDQDPDMFGVTQYETDDDRRNELSIIEEYLAARPDLRGCGFRKMTPAYELDYAILGNGAQVVEFVEIKRRQMTFGAFDDFIVGLNKLERAWSLWRASGVPTNLVLRFDDVLVSAPLGQTVDQVRWVDRAGRPDGQPHAVVFKHEFEVLRSFSE